MLDRRIARLDRRPLWQSAALAFLLYLLASLILVGHGTFAHFGSTAIGYGPDPAQFIWFMEWWPRAIVDGLDLFHPNVVWAPEGFDAALLTGVPGPGIAMAPLTLLAGPLVSYNALMIVIPAVNGWAAYLLCRAAGATALPSLAGGWLFGFSSYVLGQTLGHPNLSLVAMVPLAACLVLRRQRGITSARAFTAGLVAVLAFQFLTSTEIFLTMTLIGGLVLALAMLLLPEQRSGLASTARLIALAYALTGVLVSPYLISFLAADQSLEHISPAYYVTDPVNLFVPTRISLGGSALWPVSRHFTGNLAENGAYIGIPLLLAFGIFAWQRRRDRIARLLAGAFLIAFVASLGPRLSVLGPASEVRLPWAPFVHLPLVKYVLPQRMMMFAWIVLAVVVALWLSQASRRQAAKWALVGAGLVLLLPAPGATDPVPPHFGAAIWSDRHPVPAFFESGDRALFRGRPNILVLPYNEPWDANGDYWQANTGMAFAMPGGYVSGTVPESFECWPMVGRLRAQDYGAVGRRELDEFLASKRVDYVIAWDVVAPDARPLLRKLPQPPRRSGEVLIYRLPRMPPAPPCPRSGPSS